MAINYDYIEETSGEVNRCMDKIDFPSTKADIVRIACLAGIHSNLLRLLPARFYRSKSEIMNEYLSLLSR